MKRSIHTPAPTPHHRHRYHHYRRFPLPILTTLDGRNGVFPLQTLREDSKESGATLRLSVRKLELVRDLVDRTEESLQHRRDRIRSLRECLTGNTVDVRDLGSDWEGDDDSDGSDDSSDEDDAHSQGGSDSGSGTGTGTDAGTGTEDGDGSANGDDDSR